MSNKLSAFRAARRLAQRARSLRKDTSGIVSIEAAFILPVMFLLLLGMIDVTNMLSANRRVTLAASAIGDLTTQASGTVTMQELDDYFEAVEKIIEPFSLNGLKMQLFGFRRQGSDVVSAWNYSQGGSCGTPAGNTAAMRNLSSEGNDLVVAKVCMTWQPITGYLAGITPITLDEEIVLRPRQTSTLRCTNCPT